MTTIIEDTTVRQPPEPILLSGLDAVDDVVSAIGMGSWELDFSTGQLSWSDQTCRLHDREPGYRPTLEEGLSYYTSQSRQVIENALEQTLVDQRPWDLELELVSVRGRPFWARVVGQVELADGVPTRLTGAFQDITSRKLLERELAENRELLQVTLNSIGDAVITTDTQRQVKWMNPAAERLTGWSHDDVLGKPIADVFRVWNEVERQAVFHPVEECIRLDRTIKLAMGTVLISRDASKHAIAASAAPIQDAGGQILGAVLVFQDVTEQRRQHLAMEHRATHDPLTDLANRVAFETRVDALLARTRMHPDSAHVLLFIDLDQFKIVNDACGHFIGDALLREISQVLTSCVRDRDMVARLGGDEFAVILENCPIEHGQRIAERIRNGVYEHRFFHDERRFRVGTSIGLVPFDIRWSSREKLVQAADTACYAAKEAGRNQVKTWSESDQSVTYRLGDMQWVSRLEQAIDNDQFELYGQRIEALTGDSSDVRCEVLLRLRDLDGSLVLPRIFVPAAERFHMVARIDRWVLHRVIHLLETSPWLFDTVGMLSVNVSGQSIGDQSFHADISARLQRANFDMGKLCIEITETSAVTRLADARTFINELRGMGIKIALDDFGAGASSFGYLKALPIDFIKVDGQFTENILEDPLDIAAVRCFRDVASTLGVMTIAQYVESHEQKHALTSLGIDYGQGYGIHRPEPLEQAVSPDWSRPDAAAQHADS
ncbi:MAG: EAL domain-containing protein [Janthinobacterium lividum]